MSCLYKFDFKRKKYNSAMKKDEVLIHATYYMEETKKHCAKLWKPDAKK